MTWAIVSFDGGTAVSLGVGYALPPKYPTHGRCVRMEILGDKGVLLLDEDHKENILYTEEGFPHAYVGFDHLATGRPCAHATAEQARQTLEVTLAIEQSARSGQTVKLPLSERI